MLGINPNKLTSKYAVTGYAPKITRLAINNKTYHICVHVENLYGQQTKIVLYAR
jgi:hypothetical protein